MKKIKEFLRSDLRFEISTKNVKYFRQISVSLQVRFMDKWYFCRKMGGNISILIFYVFHFYFFFSIKDFEKNVDVPRFITSNLNFDLRITNSCL